MRDYVDEFCNIQSIKYKLLRQFGVSTLCLSLLLIPYSAHAFTERVGNGVIVDQEIIDQKQKQSIDEGGTAKNSTIKDESRVKVKKGGQLLTATVTNKSNLELKGGKIDQIIIQGNGSLHLCSGVAHNLELLDQANLLFYKDTQANNKPNVLLSGYLKIGKDVQFQAPKKASAAVSVEIGGQEDALVLDLEQNWQPTHIPFLGNGTLYKRGPGALQVAGTSIYAGNTVVEAGSLHITDQHPTEKITGTLTLQEAALELLTSASIDRPLQLAHENSQVKVAEGQKLEWLGDISGAGALVKLGSGELTVSGPVSYQGKTSIQDGLVMFKTNLAGLKDDIEVASMVAFEGDSAFHHTLLGTTPRAFALKHGSNTFQLYGNSLIHWKVLDGTLETYSPQFRGDMHLSQNAQWILLSENPDQTHIYTGQIEADGNSQIIKKGPGSVRYTYGKQSSTGYLVASEGTLLLMSADDEKGAAPDPLIVKDTLVVHADGVLELQGANTRLEVHNEWIQKPGSHLKVALDLSNKDTSAISANTISLAGTLSITGFTKNSEELDVIRVSELKDFRYPFASILKNSQATIQGDFQNHITHHTELDYLSYQTEYSEDRKTLWLNQFTLAWFDSGEKSTGNFTLTDGTSLDIDTVLSNQSRESTTDYDSVWDGKSLHKYGGGQLVLSCANTYTGDTYLHEGTLTLNEKDAIASSQMVVMDPTATLQVRGQDQTLQNLSGSGNITLENADLTLHQTAENEQEFSGFIKGTGKLWISGSQPMTLSGNLNYTEGTVITDSHLRLKNLHLKSNIDMQGSHAQLTLLPESSLSAQISSQNTHSSLILEPDSIWYLQGMSDVKHIALAGQIRFFKDHENEPLNVLRVQHLDGRQGEVVLRSELNGDASAADRIVLQENGIASGNTQLRVMPIGEMSEPTVEGVLLVDAQADGAGTSETAFTLVNHVERGAYEYTLQRNEANQSWYLRSGGQDNPAATSFALMSLEEDSYVPQIREAVFSYGRVPDLLQQEGIFGLASYQDRKKLDNRDGSKLWVQTKAQKQSGGSTLYSEAVNGNLAHTGHLGLVQLGAEWLFDGSSDWQVGAYVGMKDGRHDIQSLQEDYSPGKLKTRGYQGAFYVSQAAEDYYWDFVMQHTHYTKIDLQLPNNGQESFAQQEHHIKALQNSVSLELGTPLPLAENTAIIPQLQLIYQSSRLDDFDDRVSTIHYPKMHEGLVRLGLLLENHPTVLESESAYTWLAFDAWKQYGHSKTELLDGTSHYLHQGEKDRQWFSVRLGVNGQLGRSGYLHSEIGAEHGWQNSNPRSFSARVGYHYYW